VIVNELGVVEQAHIEFEADLDLPDLDDLEFDFDLEALGV
jgi:hypothetical protein